MPLVRIH